MSVLLLKECCHVSWNTCVGVSNIFFCEVMEKCFIIRRLPGEPEIKGSGSLFYDLIIKWSISQSVGPWTSYVKLTKGVYEVQIPKH